MESICADTFLHGIRPSTKIRLEILSQRLEEQALWREGDKTGYIRFGSGLQKPHTAKITLRFDEPAPLSEEQSREVQKILDNTANKLEALLEQ
ncbi:MAG TPA: hypothetical protein VFE98_02705 [Candidatus Bathyarchaeia archaeon]|nr:hypothetical protein [Candidatus Bathyarchaeia archaeon]